MKACPALPLPAFRVLLGSSVSLGFFWYCVPYQGHPLTVVLLLINYAVVGEGNGTPLQYSCRENPMDGGACWAAVHGVAKSQTRLNDFTFTFHFHALEKEMATHSSVLAWRIPGMGEPGGLPFYGVAQSRTRLKWLSSSSGMLLWSPVMGLPQLTTGGSLLQALGYPLSRHQPWDSNTPSHIKLGVVLQSLGFSCSSEHSPEAMRSWQQTTVSPVY